MAPKSYILLLMFVFTCSAPAAAQWHALQRGLDRVSLSLTAGYFRNPWHEYNRAIETVARRVERDVFFVHPTGSYEKINGDAGFEGRLEVRTLADLHVLLSCGYGQLDARFEFFPDTSVVPTEAHFSPAFHQELAFALRSIGAGLAYEVPLTSAFSVLPEITVHRHWARLDISWRYLSESPGPVPPGWGVNVAGRLNADTWGIQLGIGMAWQVHSKVSLRTGLVFRSAAFDGWRGPATYGVQSYLVEGLLERPFEAELVQASNHFGIRIVDSDQTDFSLPSLTFGTEPGEDARTPASIDLDAFGFRAGLRLNL